jgi:Transposase DDE domain
VWPLDGCSPRDLSAQLWAAAPARSCFGGLIRSLPDSLRRVVARYRPASKCFLPGRRRYDVAYRKEPNVAMPIVAEQYTLVIGVDTREGLVSCFCVGGLYRSCRAGTGVVGALRRDHAVLRDRRRRWVPQSGFSKERRLEPQITVGLLTDATGFPLAVGAFNGNEPETDTMLPVINAFKTAHQLTDVTVVADAGMISEANQKAITAAGLSFILGTRIPYVPQIICEWRAQHPGQGIPDQQVFTQPWPATTAEKARGIPDRVIYYQYRHDRARRTLRGIDEQVAKAEKAVAGKVSVKRNRFIKLTGAEKSVNRDLEAKARALAGIKGYTTNLTSQTAEFVIGAYHQLWRIEKSFRMSKHDLQARPIYHHKRESIEAHLSIVFAALAVSHWIEHQTGWSIKKFVQTLRRYRTVTIRAGNHTLTAADPLPADIQDVLATITTAAEAPSDSGRSGTAAELNCPNSGTTASRPRTGPWSRECPPICGARNAGHLHRQRSA